jgi:Ala-tRNA(Pro) deacylase
VIKGGAAVNIMNTLAKIKLYLDQNNIPYQVILHEEVYTAQELAQALHVPGKEIVKVVIIKADDRYCMAVLPSIRKIDFSVLQTQLHAATLTIATEQELKVLFPETEIGAMPPFGHLSSMEVWVDASLTSDEYITFNAGTHYEAISMHYTDFERLTQPHVASFSTLI